MPRNPTVSEIEIKIAGSPLPAETMDLLLEATVDQNTLLPHMFTLRFHDSDLELIDGTLFDTGKAVEIKAYTETDTGVKLFKGEITAVEPEFHEGMNAELVVRGYDKSHRMYREVKSRSFLNKKDSDIASQLAGESGLSTQIDTTSAVYEHIYQHNQTDLAFLMGRAWRIGYECFVDQGKLYFRKPPTSGASTTLKWGEDLLSFQLSMTLAEQVDEVVVRGWDMKAKQAIVGKAKSGQLYPKNGVSKNGAKQASSFGAGKQTIVNLPVVSQAEANTLAQARLNEISGAFIQALGIGFRRPDVQAGKAVKLEGLGTRFSGDYLVTSARHVYTPEGLNVEFEVSGLRSGLLSEQMRHQEPMERWPGAVVGIVTDTADPDGLGRVKVKYPWMTEDADSFWARVISPGAGQEAGLFMVPEVDDEVMVIFEHGDFDRPYVLGGVWNGQNKVPPSGAGAGNNEKPKVRTWHSIKGHHISVYDNADDKIEIVTVSGHSITLDDKNKKIEVKTSGGAKLVMDDQGRKIDMETSGAINVKSSTGMSLKSDANVTIEGAMIDVKASGPLNLKGAIVNIN